MSRAEMEWLFRQVKTERAATLNRDLFNAGQDAPDFWGKVQRVKCDSYFCFIEIEQCTCSGPASCPNPNAARSLKNDPNCPCRLEVIRVIAPP